MRHGGASPSALSLGGYEGCPLDRDAAVLGVVPRVVSLALFLLFSPSPLLALTPGAWGTRCALLYAQWMCLPPSSPPRWGKRSRLELLERDESEGERAVQSSCEIVGMGEQLIAEMKQFILAERAERASCEIVRIGKQSHAEMKADRHGATEAARVAIKVSDCATVAAQTKDTNALLE